MRNVSGRLDSDIKEMKSIIMSTQRNTVDTLVNTIKVEIRKFSALQGGGGPQEGDFEVDQPEQRFQSVAAEPQTNNPHRELNVSNKAQRDEGLVGGITSLRSNLGGFGEKITGFLK